VPTIHIRDFAAALESILKAAPSSQYIVAVDRSSDSLRDIVKAISSSIGTGDVRLPSTEESENMMLDEDAIKWQLNLSFPYNSLIVSSLNMDWACKEGLKHHIATVANEFTTAHNLRPVKLVLMGPPSSGMP
jgi:adenylate kinase